MKPAGFSYARLSLTKDSSEPNLEYQHKHNIQFLNDLGFPVVPEAIYSELLGHRSGRFIKQRTEMQRLYRELEKYRDGAGAFYDFSRFSRSTQFAFQFIEAAEKLNIKLYNASTREQITLDNVDSFLRVSIDAMFAEYESRKGTKRMLDAYERARANGYVSARDAPMGLALVGSLKERHYIKDDEYFPTTLAFFKLVAQGKSIRAATLEIQKRGLLSRGQRGQAVKFDLHQAYNLKLRFARFKPFLSESLYHQVARRLNEISQHQKRGRTPRHPGILAYGLLRCAICDRRFYAKSDVPNKKYPQYIRLSYQHIASTCPNCRHIPRHVLEDQLWDTLGKFATRLASKSHLVEYTVQLGQQAPDPAPDRRKQILEQLQTLDTNFRAVIASNAMTPAIAEQFNGKREELQGELAKLKEEIEVPRFTREDLERLAASASEWHRLADELPEQFAAMLRDIFEKITVDRDNRLVFYPRSIFASLF